jgi:hypothetical protein
MESYQGMGLFFLRHFEYERECVPSTTKYFQIDITMECYFCLEWRRWKPKRPKQTPPPKLPNLYLPNWGTFEKLQIILSMRVVLCWT